jgi:uncharacterized phiE125 gp8 family phage protein
MLTTVDRARKMLRVDPSDDDLLGLLIPAASAAIETYCNRKFTRAEYTERVDVRRSGYVLLRNYPLESVESIDDETDLSDYDIDREKGVVSKVGWNDNNPVTVIYTAGYVLPGNTLVEGATTLPADIEYGCILLIQHMRREPGVTSERVGDLAVTYAQNEGRMPPAVRALIDSYRNINL